MLLQCQAVQISHLFPKWTDLWFLALLEPFVVKTRAISSNTLAEGLVPWRQLAYLLSSVSPKWRHVSSLQWKGNTHFKTFLFYHMLCRLASPLWAAHKKPSDNGCVKITGSQPGVVLSPWRTFGNVWRNLWSLQLQGWEGVFYWHLVSRGQRCC